MNSNIVTLYHGTTHDFSAIDSSLGNPYKDFGRGFYTSRTESQAINLAIRNREIANGRLSISSTNEKVAAWLYVYEFDMQFLNFLNFKEFKKPDLQWVDFIVSNRSNPKFRHGYDMVIGPAANDDTQVTL
ncbi:MAG: DUF3990 domain-containing protein, partial [Clostridiales bacterium]|nr:DUF3990 domain-containing protein [Clostridiales bacterium]